MFWQMKITAKAAHKMLVQLIIGMPRGSEF